VAVGGQITEIHDNDCELSVGRLRNSLPQMVVDILEEKMEHEYRNGALSLLKHINNAQIPNEGGDDDADDDNNADIVGKPIVS